MYVDSTGQSVTLNTKTKAKLVVDHYEKVSSSQNSRQKGTLFDENGKAVYEISGSYLD